MDVCVCVCLCVRVCGNNSSKFCSLTDKKHKVADRALSYSDAGMLLEIGRLERSAL